MGNYSTNVIKSEYRSLKWALDCVGFDKDKVYVVPTELEALVDVLKVLEEGVFRQVLVGLFDFQHVDGAASAAATVDVAGAGVVCGVDHYLTDNVVD